MNNEKWLEMITGQSTKDREPMSEDECFQLMVDWMESTQDTIEALQVWLDALRGWWQAGGGDDEDFMATYRLLADAGLDGWADGNPLDIDRLREAITGKEV